MALNTNQFLVSVADVLLRDRDQDRIVLKGKTNVNTAMTQSMSNSEVRGGYGHGLLYTYCYEKKIEVSIEDAKFDEAYLALNNGVSIVRGLKDVYTEERVTLVAGAGTLSKTPVGDVYVTMGSGVTSTITPSGTSFTVAGGGDATVLVDYRVNQFADSITISPDDVPRSFELVMTAKIFEDSGQTGTWQLVVPSFKITGSFDLSFTSNGVSTIKLDGMALLDTVSGTYGTVNIVPLVLPTVSFVEIAATPASVTLASGASASLQVVGIRGGMYANEEITSGCTFTSSTVGVCTVSAAGVITYVGPGTSVITVTHTASGLIDTVNVTAS